MFSFTMTAQATRHACTALLLGMGIAALTPAVRSQTFGSVERKQVQLTRKLPPTGHIDGSTFQVNVTSATADVAVNLKSTLEALIVRNEPRLRSVPATEHPDALIVCQITEYNLPAAQQVKEPTLAMGAKGGPLQTKPMIRVTGVLKVAFQAQDTRAAKSIAGDSITAKFDREYPAPNAPQDKVSSTISLLKHIPSMPNVGGGGHNTGQADQDMPPNPIQLRDQLITQMAADIASNLVNTSETVIAFLAKGPGLDEANTLIQQKLFSRALEQLETMQPFPAPDADAYRIYNLGVVNEALAYQAEDFTQARKYLQEASIDYGKAIDAKPAEKQFLEPQTRIDTALAHYKTLGDQKNISVATAATAAAPAAAKPAVDTVTNDDIISMVKAKLDEANILDTIVHAGAVNFDVSPKGQIDLAKGGVSGKIITAMKQKARGQ